MSAVGKSGGQEHGAQSGVEKQWVRSSNRKLEHITGPRVHAGGLNRIGLSVVKQWEAQGMEWRQVDPLPEENGRTVEELRALGIIGIELLKPIEPDQTTL